MDVVACIPARPTISIPSALDKPITQTATTYINSQRFVISAKEYFCLTYIDDEMPVDIGMKRLSNVSHFHLALLTVCSTLLAMLTMASTYSYLSLTSSLLNLASWKPPTCSLNAVSHQRMNSLTPRALATL